MHQSCNNDTSSEIPIKMSLTREKSSGFLVVHHSAAKAEEGCDFAVRPQHRATVTGTVNMFGLWKLRSEHMIAFPMSAHFAAVTYEQHRSYHIKKGFDSVFSAFTNDRTGRCGWSIFFHAQSPAIKMQILFYNILWLYNWIPCSLVKLYYFNAEQLLPSNS